MSKRQRTPAKRGASTPIRKAQPAPRPPAGTAPRAAQTKAPVSPAILATSQAPRRESAAVGPATPPVMTAKSSLAANKAATAPDRGERAAPGKAATPPASAILWTRALARGFPYLIVEYCIFLALVEWRALAAGITGAALMVAALALGLMQGPGLRARFDGVLARLRTVEPIVGQLRDVYVSLIILGAGLVNWTTWHSTSVSFFSWVSGIALVVALFFLVRAQLVNSVSER